MFRPYRRLYQGRYRIPISTASAGMWVMVGGIDDSMIKTVTVVSVNGPEEVYGRAVFVCPQGSFHVNIGLFPHTCGSCMRGS